MPKPQKLLIGLSVVIFVISISLIIFITFTWWKNESTYPIIILNSGQYPTDESSQPINKGIKFGQTITQADSYTYLAWENGEVVLFPGSSVRIEPKSIEVTNGKVYVSTDDNIVLIINNISLNLGSSKALAHFPQSSIFILDGNLEVSGIGNIVPNEAIKITGNTVTKELLTRELLLEPEWQDIITVLQSQNVLPKALENIKPPKIEYIIPESGTTIYSSAVNVTGKVANSAQVSINNFNTNTDSDGNFSIEVNLNPGENNFSIQVIDLFGNTSTELVSYTYIVSPEDELSICINTYDTFDEQLLCMINSYRLQNRTNSLSLSNDMTAVAYKHSSWMDTSGILGHIDSEGLTFAQRCELLDTECDGGNIAKHDKPTALDIFQLWINDDEDKQNILDDHKFIGISLVGKYVTVLFK